MKEDIARFIEFGFSLPQIAFDKSPDEVYGGQSGSPSFRNSERSSFGILSLKLENVLGKGVTNGFTNNQLNDIYSWMSWNPSAIISFPNSPLNGESYNLVTIPPFEAVITPILNYQFNEGKIDNNKNLESLVEWKSSIDGAFGYGESVAEYDLKNSLSAGLHIITAEITTNGEQAETNVVVNIVVPDGNFTSPDYCIIDLATAPTNSCALDISWSVTDTPETSVVWNETDDVSFATGNSGSLSYTATTDTTVFKLYPSDEKIILLDTLNVQAKQPTGTLTSVHPNCSLQPSPYDANGNPQDPKADPLGCGTTLEWSDVQWASPGIFYRTAGSGSWQLLHQIPCALDGEVCSGSLNTDDFAQQMITSSGVEFKLLQFADAASGVLTSPFTVTAYRFADAYEFDDGWYDVPGDNHNDTLSHALAMGGTISNNLSLGQVQTNHNFHRPAAYNPIKDVDAYDIFKPNNASSLIAVEILNMASGLDVSFKVQCVGFYDPRSGPYDDIEPRDGVWDIPFNRIVSEEFVSGNKKVMKFNYFHKFTGYYNDRFYDFPGCFKNRVLVKYKAGEAGENLTYDIRAYDPSQTQGPSLDSVGPISTNNYKVELLGDNFGANPSVSVRENVNGSSALEVFPSTVFHSQGTHSSTGKDFIRFPIVQVNQQNKFNNNGLCFKVINGSDESNEQCLVRTPTNPQPAFMGEFLQSYHHVNQNQDIDTDAYIVKADGSLFKIWGNSWKKIPFNYTVTPNTEIELQFRSSLNEGEISGIGFVMNGESNLTGGKFWQFHGTQSWGNQEHNDYSGTAYKTYTIKIGQKFTGQIKNIVFVGDDDGQRVGQNIVFKPLTFSESGTAAIDAYDDVPAQRDFDDDASGKGVSWVAGDTQHLHNFHDSGDQDWTLVYGRNLSVSTQLMGANADTDLEVYKWISATPDYNLGYYVNVVDEFVGEDVAEGASEFSIFSTTDQMFGIKSSSHGNQFGAGTEYGLKIKGINPGTPDIYDVSAFGDNFEGRATHWLAGDTVHYHNFDVQGDIDWTIVAVGGNFSFTIEANATGKYGGTKMTVYKWISYDDLGGGVFTNITHQYVGQDTDGGDSLVNVHSTNGAVYAIKVESDRNAYGNNTGYTLRLH